MLLASKEKGHSQNQILDQFKFSAFLLITIFARGIKEEKNLFKFILNFFSLCYPWVPLNRLTHSEISDKD